MYDLNPPGIFVSDRVVGNSECEERLSRILDALGTANYEVVADKDIPKMLERPEWQGLQGRAGARERIDDPVFFFNTHRFDGRKEAVRQDIMRSGPAFGFGAEHISDALLGYHHFLWFNSDQAPRDIKPCPDHVCRPCWRLRTMLGCAHRCLYCDLVGFMIIGLNMREYIARLDELVEANPWQLTWLLDDESDVLITEPERGAFADLAHYFARKDNRYVVIHTKSANVDFLENLGHRGHTIMCWSLSAETQAGELEKLSGTTDERIEAARKCQQWGYPVRFKFKPVVPVRGWRDEAREMIRRVFDKTRPDNLSMTALVWTPMEKLEAMFDLDTLDPEFVDQARKTAKRHTEFPRMRPFPHYMRKEIYDFYLDEIRTIDPDVPVAISTESIAMWRELGPKLKLRPGNYTCGCGPTAVPGLKTIPENPWKIAKPVATIPGTALELQ